MYMYICIYTHTQKFIHIYIHRSRGASYILCIYILLGVAGAGAATDADTGVVEERGGGAVTSKCPFAALLAQEGGEV